MTRCDRCSSTRLASVHAKCSDCCIVDKPNYPSETRPDYVPYDMGIGGGDYVSFTWCLACGKIQDTEDAKFPIAPCPLEEEA